MLATLDGAEEHPDPEPEDDQVEDHLRGDEEAARLAGGGDVAEADRGEDGDREVQRIRASERVHCWCLSRRAAAWWAPRPSVVT